MTPEQVMEQWEANFREYEALGELNEETKDPTLPVGVVLSVTTWTEDILVLPNMKMLKSEEAEKFRESCTDREKKALARTWRTPRRIGG